MLDTILDILREVNPFEEIEADTELIESGILDSLSIVYVMNELQAQFGIEIPEEYLQAENFCSASEIMEIIEKCNG